MKKLALIVCLCVFSQLTANTLRTELNFFNPNDIKYIEDNMNQYKSKCEARDGDACYNLGIYYSEQFSRSRNTDAQAKELKLKYLTKGCNELRNGRSCNGLSNHYSVSEVDEAKSFEFAQKGCDYNDARSCDSVGFHYWDKARKETDRNLKKQYQSKARIAYKKACDMGRKTACSSYKDL